MIIGVKTIIIYKFKAMASSFDTTSFVTEQSLSSPRRGSQSNYSPSVAAKKSRGPTLVPIDEGDEGKDRADRVKRSKNDIKDLRSIKQLERLDLCLDSPRFV
jgi:hypothetical protein